MLLFPSSNHLDINELDQIIRLSLKDAKKETHLSPLKCSLYRAYIYFISFDVSFVVS